MATSSVLTYKKCVTRILEEQPYSFETGGFFTKKRHTGVSLVRPKYGTFKSCFEITNRHGTNIFTIYTGTITLESIESEVERWTDDNWPKRYMDTETSYYYYIEKDDAKKIATHALAYLESFSKQGLITKEAEIYFLPWLNGKTPFGRALFSYKGYNSGSISNNEMTTYPYTETCQVTFTLPAR